jgi:hypothetical protein
VNEITPFINISGLEDLVHLLFKISLKKEESRYPSFQVYVPPSIYGCWEPVWLTCFDPPITLVESFITLPLLDFWWKWYCKIKNDQALETEALDLWVISLDYYLESYQIATYNIDILHRISSGIPSRPYAIYVREEEGAIKAYGIIKIEDLRSLSDNNSNSKSFIINKIDGMIISIDGPGLINVSLSNGIWDYAKSISFNLSLKHGDIEARYNDLYFAMYYLFEDSKNGTENLTKENLSSNMSNYISNIWSYILSLSANFGHGGQFILLPPGLSLGKVDPESKNSFLDSGDEPILQVKHKISEPNLGLKIISLDRATSATKGYQPQAPVPFLVGKPSKHDELPEENFSIAFERGIEQGFSKARKIQECYQDLLDTARIIAKLSTVDGCLVFNSDFQLIGFKGEVLVREDSKCVNKLDEEFKSDEKFDINQFGTRHRSAARFCGKIPNSVVFVVSQDGDIRVFKHMDNGEVGVAGPFYSWPGTSPNIGSS